MIIFDFDGKNFCPDIWDFLMSSRGVRKLFRACSGSLPAAGLIELA